MFSWVEKQTSDLDQKMQLNSQSQKIQTLKCLSVWKLFTSKSFQGKNLLIKNKTAADYWFCVLWSLWA
jgi:hypothetical protein